MQAGRLRLASKSSERWRKKIDGGGAGDERWKDEKMGMRLPVKQANQISIIEPQNSNRDA